MKKQILTILCLLGFLINLFLVSAVSITDVSCSPQEVAPGEIVEITIKVENIFGYDVNNLNVKLDLSGEDTPFAPYQSSSEEFLEELESEKDENFKFKLITLPETASGIYKIPIEITYEKEEGNSSIKNELISLIVNSEPELKISLDDSVLLIRGGENTLSIKLVNSGLADVKFVYLTAINSGGIKILSEKGQYIGDIDSDDFDSVEYNVYIDKDAPNTISLPIILKFKDATNKEFIETKNVILNTYSLKEAQNLGLVKKPKYTIYFTIVILIIGYIIYRVRKKKRLKNK